MKSLPKLKVNKSEQLDLDSKQGSREEQTSAGHEQ